MKTKMFPMALAACLVLTALPGSALSQQPSKMSLVGASLSTAQAILWDHTLEEYAVVRLGKTYRGFTIKRILADRVVLLRDAVVHELPLSRSPFYHGGPRTERRGEPAGIIIAHSKAAPRKQPAGTAPASTTPVRTAAVKTAPVKPGPSVARVAASSALDAAHKLASAKARPAATSPTPKPAAAKKPATATSPTPGPAAAKKSATAAKPARATPTPAAPVSVSMPRVRAEVSDFFRRKVDYRARFASGGVQLTRVERTSLLYRIGLRAGDQVTRLNGWKLTSSDAAMDAYLSLQSGSQVQVVYQRRGKRQVLSVHLV